jgi:hypothetical protein
MPVAVHVQSAETEFRLVQEVPDGLFPALFAWPQGVHDAPNVHPPAIWLVVAQVAGKDAAE